MAPSVRVVPSHLACRYAKRKSSAFTTASHSSEKYVPKELSTPLTRICGTHLIIYFHFSSTYMIVQGHLSIVNTTLIHPVLPLIATAGIERQVVLHSPTPNTPWAPDLPITPTATRSLPSDGLSMTDPSSLLRLLIRMNTFMEPDESLGEDARSIAYFDMYVSFLMFL
jgi:hypothetical protein